VSEPHNDIQTHLMTKVRRAADSYRAVAQNLADAEANLRAAEARAAIRDANRQEG
jgi:hypothetical protein